MNTALGETVLHSYLTCLNLFGWAYLSMGFTTGVEIRTTHFLVMKDVGEEMAKKPTTHNKRHKILFCCLLNLGVTTCLILC